MSLRDVLEIVQAAAVVIAAAVAVYGINAWRREAIGQRKIELAEDVLARFYEARDVIRVIRSPMGFVGEGNTRTRGPNESERESSILDNAYVVYERYEKNRDLFNNLRSTRYRFMAHHGQAAGAPFDQLNQIVSRIFIASRMLARSWQDQGQPFPDDASFQRHLERMEAHEAVFWESSPTDPLNGEVDEVVHVIESICGPLIQQAASG